MNKSPGDAIVTSEKKSVMVFKVQFTNVSGLKRIHNGLYHYHHTYIFHCFGFTFFHRTLMTWVTSLIISVVCATVKL